MKLQLLVDTLLTHEPLDRADLLLNLRVHAEETAEYRAYFIQCIPEDTACNHHRHNTQHHLELILGENIAIPNGDHRNRREVIRREILRRPLGISDTSADHPRLLPIRIALQFSDQHPETSEQVVDENNREQQLHKLYEIRNPLREVEPLFNSFENLRDLHNLQEESHLQHLHPHLRVHGVLIELPRVRLSAVERRLTVEGYDKRHDGENISHHMLLNVILYHLRVRLYDLPLIEEPSVQIHNDIDDEHVWDYPQHLHRYHILVTEVEDNRERQAEETHDNHEHVEEVPHEFR